jgi:hypothetical protein
VLLGQAAPERLAGGRGFLHDVGHKLARVLVGRVAEGRLVRLVGGLGRRADVVQRHEIHLPPLGRVVVLHVVAKLVHGDHQQRLAAHGVEVQEDRLGCRVVEPAYDAPVFHLGRPEEHDLGPETLRDLTDQRSLRPDLALGDLHVLGDAARLVPVGDEAELLALRRQDLEQAGLVATRPRDLAAAHVEGQLGPVGDGDSVLVWLERLDPLLLGHVLELGRLGLKLGVGLLLGLLGCRQLCVVGGLRRSPRRGIVQVQRLGVVEHTEPADPVLDVPNELGLVLRARLAHLLAEVVEHLALVGIGQVRVAPAHLADPLGDLQQVVRRHVGRALEQAHGVHQAAGWIEVRQGEDGRRVLPVVALGLGGDGLLGGAGCPQVADHSSLCDDVVAAALVVALLGCGDSLGLGALEYLDDSLLLAYPALDLAGVVPVDDVELAVLWIFPDLDGIDRLWVVVGHGVGHELLIDADGRPVAADLEPLRVGVDVGHGQQVVVGGSLRLLALLGLPLDGRDGRGCRRRLHRHSRGARRLRNGRRLGRRRLGSSLARDLALDLGERHGVGRVEVDHNLVRLDALVELPTLVGHAIVAHLGQGIGDAFHLFLNVVGREAEIEL